MCSLAHSHPHRSGVSHTQTTVSTVTQTESPDPRGTGGGWGKVGETQNPSRRDPCGSTRGTPTSSTPPRGRHGRRVSPPPPTLDEGAITDDSRSPSPNSTSTLTRGTVGPDPLTSLYSRDGGGVGQDRSEGVQTQEPSRKGGADRGLRVGLKRGVSQGQGPRGGDSGIGRTTVPGWGEGPGVERGGATKMSY